MRAPESTMHAPLDSPDLLADPMAPLLHADAPAGAAPPAPMRQRLLDRVRHSAALAQAMHTRRYADAARTEVAEGVRAASLYAAAGATRRPGEPESSMLIELQPGAGWLPPASTLQREWFVVRGSVTLGSLALQPEDFHLQPAGTTPATLHSDTGALLLLREAAATASGQAELTQHAADADWAAFGPGIERRVMWQDGRQAAMLYRTLPGAAVPRHGHGHDEECLMLAGDIFLDDVLLRPLDYQLAPAGTGHGGVGTDTGVVLYAHGDLDLDLQPT